MLIAVWRESITLETMLFAKFQKMELLLVNLKENFSTQICYRMQVNFKYAI